jgi:transcription initiation factor TFIIH subunit 4
MANRTANIAFGKLKKLSVISLTPQGASLHPVFRQNLHLALTGGGGPQFSFGLISDGQDKYDVSLGYLDSYATHAWESVLHYLVGTPSDQKSTAVIHLLGQLGLMQQGYSLLISVVV